MKRTRLMNIKVWNIRRITGYEPRTVWYEYFSIADHQGEHMIRNLYNDILHRWGDDVGLMTELSLILNWKAAEHDGKNPVLAELYKKLWRKIDNEIFVRFDHDDFLYYLQETCGKKVTYY